MIDFRAVSTYEKSINDHRTGRKCALCGGKLLDSIINFGEQLPEKDLENAFSHARKADLCLVLGSSLRVTPAADVPEAVTQKRSAKLVICNLQATPLDGLSSLRVHSKADDLMVQVMEKLKLPIPPFVLHRRLVVKINKSMSGQYQVVVEGRDPDGTPASFLRTVKITDTRRVARAEPFVLSLRDELHSGMKFVLELEFMGHYAEPNLQLEHTYDAIRQEESQVDLHYDPQIGDWKVQHLQQEKEEEGHNKSEAITADVAAMKLS